jgi:aminobenzoyl-glutamate utilization protein B
MSLTAEQKKIITAIEKHQSEFWKISDAIWHYAELGFQETQSSKILADVLKQAGFEVQQDVAGMPTAFTATWQQGSGKPALGLLAEYDALPGLSQIGGSPKQEPLVAGAPGHGCGHNSMGPMQVLAAVAFKEWAIQENLNITLKVFGSPAEEILASRPFMVRAGLLRDLDTIIDCHASSRFEAVYGTVGSALYSLWFDFCGKTSHAGFDPWVGRSAADAVELMHAATERMREHVPPTTRIHWITTFGGDAPNIVPERAATWYMVRDTDANLKQVKEWVCACAEAAARMTQTRSQFRILTGIYQRHYNQALARIMFKHIQAVGLPRYSPDEENYARALQKNAGLKEIGLDYKVGLCNADAGPFEGGSSDVGDVCMNVPTGCLRFPVSVPGSPGHHWTVASAGATPIAHKGLSAGAKVTALTLYDLARNPELFIQIKKDFADLIANNPYQSFLAADTKPPLDFYNETQARYREALAVKVGEWKQP